ncbi:sensor histidine kinase [Microlunatus parietis]|uniref:Two-component system sensor histidine kinase DesK n=1 Tax=Microlunatus parietis TaxID=682979 RepID=A0A7Y9I352_9ACTN|nr:histidine kinase [Microlunatus parietis]NYE69352.1 two-component system sensor histidine kinase DesK [Microlunatus parietis]
MRWRIKPWRERSQPERFDAYMRWSLYPLSALPPFIYAFQLAAGRGPVDWLAWAALLPYVTQTVLNLIMLRRTLAGDRIRRPLAVAQILCGAAVLIMLGLTRAPAESLFLSPSVFGQLLVITGVAASWVPVLRPRTVALVGAGCVVIMIGLQLPYGPVAAVLVSFGALVWVIMWLSVYASSAWMLRVVRELDRARGTAARLAVAEERLRFSRDVHDVFGRVLAAVAVKSELAAQLTGRRPDDAATTMLEVRQLAQDSLAEVRAVAAGYRQADLGQELRGARALLDSAGIACAVLGEDLELPDQQATAFGWAVREAVTNVIRHSAATECTISITKARAWARLEVINNGVEADPGETGSGLLGLAERLEPLGGVVEQRRSGATFTLLVTLPTKDDVP